MDLIEILDDYEIDYKQHGQHNSVRDGFVGVDCPWCNEETGKYYLGISIRNGFSSCWKCGYHSLPYALAKITHQSADVFKKLLNKFLPKRVEDHPFNHKLQLPNGIEPLARAHRRYLKQRGFDPEFLQYTWELRSFCVHPTLSWRIFIPIHDIQGYVVSWTTRAIGDDVSPRYINAKPNEESFPQSKLLYGEHKANGSIIIVEGPADVWKIGPGAVATLGLTCTPAQIGRMAGYIHRTVCFDNEPAAQKRAERLGEELSMLPGKTELVCLDSADPGEATDKEIQQLRSCFL